jgi:hypothetical protein
MAEAVRQAAQNIWFENSGEEKPSVKTMLSALKSTGGKRFAFSTGVFFWLFARSQTVVRDRAFWGP